MAIPGLARGARRRRWLARGFSIGSCGGGRYAAPALSDDPIIDLHSDEFFMRQALREAQRAYAAAEVPIGAVVVRGGRVIARAWNQVETLKDATAHAEMLALTAAQQALGDWRLEGCTLYATKEPCPMCAGAVVNCRPDRVVFGTPDLRCGAVGGWINLLEANPPLNHRCDVTAGVLAGECLALLQQFFREAREKKRNGEPDCRPRREPGAGGQPANPPERQP